MDVYISIMASIGEGIEKLEPAKKLIDSIAALLGKSKETEDRERHELPQTERKRIEPPRKQIAHQLEPDDGIPF